MSRLVLLLITLPLPFAFAAPAHAAKITPETRAMLETRRADIEKWAPMRDGAIALSKDGYQGDMIEFTGFRCATGDLERCEDIRRCQASNGRFWRSPALIEQPQQDSFSRDMFMGLMFYFGKTKDKDALKRWLHYLETHNNKMCDDATDNRCTLMPTTWGMLGLVKRHLGMKRSFKEKLGASLLPAEMLISAATAPRGFQLMLVMDNVYFLRSIGIRTSWMARAAKIALKRQPDNPMIRYLVYGATEKLAQDVLDACPATATERMDDIFWQRRLGRNKTGELIVIRDDWGPQNSRIPVYTMANGHDCIVLMNLLLRKPL